MRFSKVGIFGTLMAAAVAMLVVLPVLADIAANDVVTLEAVGSAEDSTDSDLKWISTDPDASPPDGSANAGEGNKDLVIVHDEEATTFGELTRTVDIESSAGSAEITVDLASTNDHYEGTFTVVTSATDDSADEILGRHDGKITITYVPFDPGLNTVTQTCGTKVDEDGTEGDGHRDHGPLSLLYQQPGRASHHHAEGHPQPLGYRKQLALVFGCYLSRRSQPGT